jgi:arylformamidase
MTLVYRDYDQRALDFQYDNQAQVADPKRYLDWYATVSERVRSRVFHESDIAYGALPDEKLDIFFPPAINSHDRRPVVVFVHGGAWRNLDRACSGFAAETFTLRGAIYVALGFSRMPAAGSLDEMVAQVRVAITWLHSNVAEYGGDPQKLHLIAHSSGAHLAAMAIGTDWPRARSLPSNAIRGAVLISGIYDLEPVRLSYRNDMLKLDRAAEIRNSPCRNLPDVPPEWLIGYGERDGAEFRRQSQEYARAWKRRYLAGKLLELPGLNHFETIETLADADSILSRASTKHFGLS